MVTRYDVGTEYSWRGEPYPAMEESRHGGYVRYEDYEELEKEMKILKEKLKDLCLEMGI